MRTIPASAATDLPDGLTGADVLWDETLGANGYATRVLERGARVRLTDLQGDACLGLLLFNADNPVERLNVADTVKVQWNAYLAPGRLLLSDMGRSLASVMADTGATHDALCGAAPQMRERFLLALAKEGLGRADLVANVNLFKGVRVTDDGSLVFYAQSSAPNARVELRMDMDVLMIVANGTHVLDPRPDAPVGMVRVLAHRGQPAADDDPVRNATPENQRAFENTDDYFLR
jgi:uncharacterized protein YcgI (DUF1989 family)